MSLVKNILPKIKTFGDVQKGDTLYYYILNLSKDYLTGMFRIMQKSPERIPKIIKPCETTVKSITRSNDKSDISSELTFCLDDGYSQTNLLFKENDFELTDSNSAQLVEFVTYKLSDNEVLELCKTTIENFN